MHIHSHKNLNLSCLKHLECIERNVLFFWLRQSLISFFPFFSVLLRNIAKEKAKEYNKMKSLLKRGWSVLSSNFTLIKFVKFILCQSHPAVTSYGCTPGNYPALSCSSADHRPAKWKQWIASPECTSTTDVVKNLCTPLSFIIHISCSSIKSDHPDHTHLSLQCITATLCPAFTPGQLAAARICQQRHNFLMVKLCMSHFSDLLQWNMYRCTLGFLHGAKEKSVSYPLTSFLNKCAANTLSQHYLNPSSTLFIAAPTLKHN